MRSPLAGCVLMLAMIAGPALADDLVSTSIAPAQPKVLAATKAASPFDAVTPIDAKALGAVRAGEDVYAALSDQRLSATNSGNSITANSVQSGAVNLQDGAFNGFNGIGNFVINTGNNNNLQGSLSVTILMAPAAAMANR